jgi:primosomal protein N' (replication factor Y)
MVVLPTAAECGRLASALETTLGPRVVTVTSSLGGGELTAAWSLLAAHGGLLAVGTRELALWPCHDLGVAVVVEEGRPAMKAKQTPTFHVRDVLRRRSAVERFSLVFLGPVPTLEALAAGVDVVEPRGRVWPHVEVVDRNDEPPGGGVIGERARAAIAAVAGRGGTVFVLVPRRGYAGAFACVRCGTIRRCGSCGAAAGRTSECGRCSTPLPATCPCGGDRFRPLGAGIGSVSDDLRRSLSDAVGEVGSGRQVQVGTERDLVGIGQRDLAVAIDLDGGILAPHYRGAEDAMRLGARLAATVAGGRGRRCLVQTSIPDHPVMAALRAGTPMGFLRDELAAREQAMLPPVGELIALEVWDTDLGHADAVIRAAAESAAVRGPATDEHGGRWLVQGADLHETRLRLRQAVQGLRDGGGSVRVDADPVDL